MGDTKISALTAASTVGDSDLFALVQSSTSKKLAASALSPYLRPWEGNICGIMGDGDPLWQLRAMLRDSNVAPTPTNISTSVARISYFRLRTALTVNKIRYYGVGATTSIYRIALYNGSSLARVLTETAFTTTANAWGSIGSSLNLTLSAGQLYFLAVSVNATGSTAGVAAFGDTTGATTGAIEVLPASWPGNLNVTASFGISCGFAQGTVTSGALPDPFPTVAAVGTWTGGMPSFFLDNSNS